MRSIIPKCVAKASLAPHRYKNHCRLPKDNPMLDASERRRHTNEFASKSDLCPKATDWSRICKGGYYFLRSSLCEMIIFQSIHKKDSSGIPTENMYWDPRPRFWYWCLFSIVEIVVIVTYKQQQRYSKRRRKSSSMSSTTSTTSNAANNDKLLADDASKQIPEMSTVSSYSEICDDSVSGIISNFESHSETDEIYVDTIPSPLRSKPVAVQQPPESPNNRAATSSTNELTTTDPLFVPEYESDTSDGMATTAKKTQIGKRQRIPTNFLWKEMSQPLVEPLAAQAPKPSTSSRKRARDPHTTETPKFDKIQSSRKKRRRDTNPSESKNQRQSSPVAETDIVKSRKTKGRVNPSAKSVTFDTNDILPKYTTTSSSSNKNISRWEAKFRLLLEYKRKFQTTRVPQHSVEHKTLAVWVKSQRQRYSQGKVNRERVELLESIGFEWDPGKVEWMKNYERLVAFKQATGTTIVPQDYKKDPQLGRWVKNQRHKCKMQYRIDLLNEIEFVWKV